jgi:hypothetical protein
MEAKLAELGPSFPPVATATGEILAVTVLSFGEPESTQRPRIYKALRWESRDVGYSLAAIG